MPIRPSVSKAWTSALAEPLGLGVEQPAEGTADAIGLQRLLERLRLQQDREAGERALLPGAEASEVSADQRCSLASGDGDAFPGRGSPPPIPPPRRARPDRRCAPAAAARRKLGSQPTGAAEIVPVAAHGERRGADRAAEIEGEDLARR